MNILRLIKKNFELCYYNLSCVIVYFQDWRILIRTNKHTFLYSYTFLYLDTFELQLIYVVALLIGDPTYTPKDMIIKSCLE